MSRLGWEDEASKPVKKSHVQLLEFPKRADAFHDVLIECIAELIKSHCPADTMPILYNATNEGASESWQQVASLSIVNQSMQSLQLGKNESNSLEYHHTDDVLALYSPIRMCFHLYEPRNCLASLLPTTKKTLTFLDVKRSWIV
jgi:hypothetical protein